ncbi:MAG: helix-turn-helix transcriptional regulator [Pseudonocardiaceae bacterium]
MAAPGKAARRRFARRRKALGFTQESLAALLHVERSTVVRWESGKSEPLAWQWPKLATALRVTPDQLADLFTETPVRSPLNITIDHDGQVEDDMNRRGTLKVLAVGAASLAPLADIRTVVLDAARGSALLRASVETPGISDFALIDARQQLHRLATDYALTSDLNPILRELVGLRNHLYTTLTTRQHHPGDTRDLYVLLGAACVLLASISHDLSEPNAGMTQAVTAETFAELSGHRELLTWAHCTKAMIASWWTTPAEVLHHTEKAHAVGAVGVSATRLAGLHARALAQLGKRTEAITVLRTAQDQRDKIDDTNGLQELGEVFTFSPPRQHYYNAATHLHLGDWRQVEHETNTVTDLYGAPAAGQVWPVTLTLSRIYQAQARLHEYGPEGASETLRPVLDMPVRQRLPQTSQALTGLRQNLQSKKLAMLPAARDLDEAIGAFQSSMSSS